MARISGDSMAYSNDKKEVRFSVSDFDKIEMNPKCRARRRSSLVTTTRFDKYLSTHAEQETESEEFESAESMANHWLQNWSTEKFKERRYSLTMEKINSLIDEEIFELANECDSYKGQLFQFKPLTAIGKTLLSDNREYMDEKEILDELKKNPTEIFKEFKMRTYLCSSLYSDLKDLHEVA